MGIGKFKLIKKLLKFAGNGINKIANSKVVRKIIEPVSAVAGLIPVVGRVVEHAIDNIPQNVGWIWNTVNRHWRRKECFTKFE